MRFKALNRIGCFGYQLTCELALIQESKLFNTGERVVWVVQPGSAEEETREVFAEVQCKLEEGYWLILATSMGDTQRYLL